MNFALYHFFFQARAIQKYERKGGLMQVSASRKRCSWSNGCVGLSLDKRLVLIFSTGQAIQKDVL